MTTLRVYIAGAVLAVSVSLAPFAALAAEAVSKPSRNDPSRSEPSLVEDLVTALTIQGIDCDKAAEVRRKGPDDFQVECRGGGRFRLSVLPDGKLGLFNLVQGAARSGVAGIQLLLRATGRTIGIAGTAVAHNDETAGHLFAMIRLSGRECDEITNVQRLGEDDRVVSCTHGQAHRIYNASDGLVKVEDP